ncbi:MAG: hypothetical protein Salg2KO_13710 [Salibacteraceae bacterium]
MDAIPIIVIGFNRPDSLTRIFKSLDNAHYERSDIPLYISLDRSESSDCIEVARNFQWNHGIKHIIEQQNHLGLFNHVLHCGDLVLELGKAIILEDDLLVAPHFYAFAEQTVEAYGSEDQIAGISLYGYSFTESRFVPFCPLSAEFDTYFMQVSSSWGQVWTANQWRAFRAWFDRNPVLLAEEQVPEYILDWGENSWKKQFNRYLVDQGKYFVFPSCSYTTNFEDQGTHATTRGLFQVPLNRAYKPVHLDVLSTSTNRYDAWFEIEVNSLQKLCPKLQGESIAIDTYGTKPRHIIDAELVLTTRPVLKYELSWNGDMFPKTQSVLNDVRGDGLWLAKPENIDWTKQPTPSYHFQIRSLLESADQQPEVFHVFITGDVSDTDLFQQTLKSMECQSYGRIQLTVFVDSSLSIPSIKSELPITVIRYDEMLEALHKRVSEFQRGFVLVLDSGECLDRNALQSASEIFSQYNDVNWLYSVTPDRNGFIPLNIRYALGIKEQIGKRDWSPFEHSSSFFRSSWFGHEKVQSAMSLNTFGQALSKIARDHNPPTVLAMGFRDPKTSNRIRDFKTKPRGIIPLIIYYVCKMINGISSSTIPHKFYTVYFNLGDVIRFDSGHKTWYKERF